MPQPSPRAKPSAAASKVLQRPSGASMCALVSAIVVCGEHITFTPPASASRTRRCAGSAAPGAAPPATTNRRCRSTAPAPAGRGSTRCARRRRCAHCPRRGRRRWLVAAVEHALEVVAVADADEHAGGRAGQRRRARCRHARALPRPLRATRRCCGSIVSASRGAMPKNAGVEAVDAVEKAAAARTDMRAGASGSGSNQASMSQRSAGTSRIASRPSRSSCQNACGIVGAAGKAAADADDRDRLARLRRLELLVQLEREQRQPFGRQLADAVEEVAGHVLGPLPAHGDP